MLQVDARVFEMLVSHNVAETIVLNQLLCPPRELRVGDDVRSRGHRCTHDVLDDKRHDRTPVHGGRGGGYVPDAVASG